MNVQALLIVAGLLGALLLPPRGLLAALLLSATTFNPAVRIGPVAIYLASSFLVLLFGRTVIQRLQERNFPIELSTRTDKAIFVFTCWTMFCTLAFGSGVMSYKREIGILLFVIAYFSLRSLIHERRELENLLRWIGYSTVPAALLGFYTLLYKPFLGSKHMAYGTFGNPNGLAAYLMLTIPLAVYFASKERVRPLWWGLLLLPLICILRTGSRTGTLALAVIAFAWLSLRHRRIFLLCLLISPSILFLSEEHFQLTERYGTIFNITTIVDMQKVHLVPHADYTESQTFSGLPWTSPGEYDAFPDSLGARYVIWGQALLKIQEAPIVGWGPNNIRLSGLPYDSKWFDNCFNQYLSITLDFGLIGLFCLIAIAVSIRSDTLDARSRWPYDDISLLLGSILFGQLVHACAEDPIYAIMSNWTLAFILAAQSSLSLSRFAPEEES